MSISTKNDDKKKPKSTTMWQYNGFFLGECANFNLEKANLPENSLFDVNQGYLTHKDGKKMLLHRCLYYSADNAACTST